MTTAINVLCVKYVNEADGIHSEVRQFGNDFYVSLWDTDAGERLPLISIYHDLESASAKARSLVAP